MVTCDLCGGEEFEKHEGFMYCAVCQTQSQHYHEQEYDYQAHELNTSRRHKSPAKKARDEKVCDDGFWTTWEAFNYILHGMTEEMKKCGASEEVRSMVFKLWAAYLKECKVAFISKYEEKIPKLGFGFKKRDVRVLYNIDLTPNIGRKRSSRSRSCSSKFSNTSNSSFQSKRSVTLQKGKMIAAEYQDYLLESAQSNSNLDDETLESLGNSSDYNTSEESSVSTDDQVKSLKNVLLKKDYMLYKKSHNSKRSKQSAKHEVAPHCPGKNKLLSIIHLALLMTRSEIQLSDLLRFIRESHLSFAKVTHFFPKEVKFPKKDFTYIEIVTDHIMPSHFAQRKIVGKMARLLKVEKIPTPDMTALIDRYCLDLNLPDQVGEFGKKVIADFIPTTTTPGYEMLEPNYEAWAMSSIIIALKYFFGINDKTEIFLSHLANEINNLRSHECSLFVFQDWQKFIECRKTVLMNFHYPTEEQLGRSCFRSSKNFLGMLMTESKDEHRNDRFIRYPRYYMDENFLKGVKEMLNTLSKPQDLPCFDFKPSLTPQVSNLETIMRGRATQKPIPPFFNYCYQYWYSSAQVPHPQRHTPNNIKCASETVPLPFVVEPEFGELALKMECLKFKEFSASAEREDSRFPVTVLPENILNQNFKNCDIKFATDSRRYLNFLEENSDLFTKFGIAREPSQDSSEGQKEDFGFLFECSSRYWIFRFPGKLVCNLNEFSDEVLSKTPENFQWLIKECSRMLEMNVRELYLELLRMEVMLSSGFGIPAESDASDSQDEPL